MNAVTLRPVEEDDLDAMARFSVEPDALGEFEWTGFTDPRALRRRWEEDGLLADDSSFLAVVTPDATFAGCVSWRSAPITPTRGAPRRASSILHLDIGIALLPEHRDKGYGSAAQAALVDYLFATTAVHRIQATTEAGNLAEQKALEKMGISARRSHAGRWLPGRPLGGRGYLFLAPRRRTTLSVAMPVSERWPASNVSGGGGRPPRTAR